MISEAHDIAQARQLLARNKSEDLAQELAWSAAHHGCPQIVELALQQLPWPQRFEMALGLNSTDSRRKR
ncbi:MAG TPA: hypothetical protein VH351_17345 [Bryobacteraceae bacterium]|jgi:hypothetical protein|nr:hypothetical protein [Bryobacteraceae bacterium]